MTPVPEQEEETLQALIDIFTPESRAACHNQ
jgi:hypothetical protein